MSRKRIDVGFGASTVSKDHDTAAAEHDAWFRRRVQAGLDDATAGRLVPGEEVEAEFAARRKASRRRIATG